MCFCVTTNLKFEIENLKYNYALAEQPGVLATLSRWRSPVRIRPGVLLKTEWGKRKAEVGRPPLLTFRPLLSKHGIVAQFGRGARLRTEMLGVRISPMLFDRVIGHSVTTTLRTSRRSVGFHTADLMGSTPMFAITDLKFQISNYVSDFRPVVQRLRLRLDMPATMVQLHPGRMITTSIFTRACQRVGTVFCKDGYGVRLPAGPLHNVTDCSNG